MSLVDHVTPCACPKACAVCAPGLEEASVAAEMTLAEARAFVEKYGSAIGITNSDGRSCAEAVHVILRELDRALAGQASTSILTSGGGSPEKHGSCARCGCELVFYHLDMNLAPVPTRDILCGACEGRAPLLAYRSPTTPTKG